MQDFDVMRFESARRNFVVVAANSKPMIRAGMVVDVVVLERSFSKKIALTNSLLAVADAFAEQRRSCTAEATLAKRRNWDDRNGNAR